MSDQLLVGEPQCWDYEHSSVNASLVHTLLLAYPNSPLLFLGEKSHQARMRELLAAQAPGEATRITWRPVDIPPRRARTFKRLWKEWSVFRTIMKTASREDVSLVIITSATEIGFFMLKILLAFNRGRIPVVAVLHGVLATLVRSAPRKRFSSLRGMRLVFRLPHPRRLWYLAYGPSILSSLRELQPKAASHTIEIELPFSWSNRTMPSLPPAGPPKVQFGYFGVSGGRGKGFDRFVRLAEEVRSLRGNALFTMVGHLSTDEDRARYGRLFPDAPPVPLSLEAYGTRALQLTYAVSLTDPEVYRVGASTSFLDALSFIKPGIYLRNMYIEECFRKMGDIGYLCDSVDDIRECMLGILDDFPAERYAAQCGTILKMRRIFEPTTIAVGFRIIVERLRATLS